MKRILVEPITKTNLTEVGDENLDALIAFHKTRIERYVGTNDAATSEKILPILENEKLWRDEIRKVRCPWLLLSGFCRHAEVTAKHGEEHACPKLLANPCTQKKMQLFARF